MYDNWFHRSTTSRLRERILLKYLPWLKVQVVSVVPSSIHSLDRDNITLSPIRPRLQPGVCSSHLRPNCTLKLLFLTTSAASAIDWLHPLTDLYVKSLPIPIHSTCCGVIIRRRRIVTSVHILRDTLTASWLPAIHLCSELCTYFYHYLSSLLIARANMAVVLPDFPDKSLTCPLFSSSLRTYLHRMTQPDVT